VNTPVVLVTELPPGESPASLAPTHEPALRIVHALARPDMRKVASLAYDVLAGMDKSVGVRGGSRKDGLDVSTRVAPWLMAYGTEWVVLFSAQEVPAILLAGGILDPVSAAGARLLLVADSGQRSIVMNRVAGYDAETIDYRTWANENGVVLGPITAPEAEPASGGSGWDSIEVPHADWPWFRARCRDQLGPDQFAAVDALYLKALRTIYDQAPDYPAKTQLPARLDVTPIVALCGSLLENRYTRAECTVVLRGTQAALFRRGYLLRAQVDALLDLLVNGDRPVPLTDRQWRALRGYQQQWRSAAIALAASGFGISDTLSLTVGDVQRARAATATELLPGKNLDPRGWPLVLAQMFERLGEGAADGEVLFTSAHSMIARALRDTRADLGLRLGGRVPIKQGRTPEENWLDLVSRRFILIDIR
jgi:hypothetical protein